MPTDFYRLLYYSILIIAAIISMLFYKQVKKPFKWLCVLVVLTLVSEFTAKLVVPFSLFSSNNIVYHFFTIIEYALYSIVYHYFFNSKKWDKVLLACTICLAIVAIFNTILYQSLKETPTNIMIAESVLLVFLSLSLFTRIRAIPVYNNILKEGVFWFNCAVLFYYSYNILVWGFHNIMVYQLKNPPQIVYDVLLLFSGFLYIVFATSIALNFVSTNKTQAKYE